MFRTKRTRAHHDSKTPSQPRKPASALSNSLSQVEFALVTLVFGFSRWVESCMDAAGYRGLSALDVLVLHAVNHRARGCRLSDICTVLNIDDTHLVSYALKKLVAADLVTVIREGRERHFETSARGDEACAAYREVRDRNLVPSVGQIAGDLDEMARVEKFLCTMTILYDQAGRFAIAESRSNPLPPRVRTKR